MYILWGYFMFLKTTAKKQPCNTKPNTLPTWHAHIHTRADTLTHRYTDTHTHKHFSLVIVLVDVCHTYSYVCVYMSGRNVRFLAVAICLYFRALERASHSLSHKQYAVNVCKCLSDNKPFIMHNMSKNVQFYTPLKFTNLLLRAYTHTHTHAHTLACKHILPRSPLQSLPKYTHTRTHTHAHPSHRPNAPLRTPPLTKWPPLPDWIFPIICVGSFEF